MLFGGVIFIPLAFACHFFSGAKMNFRSVQRCVGVFKIAGLSSERGGCAPTRCRSRVVRRIVSLTDLVWNSKQVTVTVTSDRTGAAELVTGDHFGEAVFPGKVVPSN